MSKKPFRERICLPGLLILFAAGAQAASFPDCFKDGTLHIVASSHQDIAWMDTIARCVQQRDEQVITPALERMKQDPAFKFVMEDTLCLMEYLERHPDRKDEVLARTKEGRFEWAGTYTQPYESLESGEQLVRQLYLGRKWIKHMLPGCDTTVAWSPDVPGRAMQMPQILHKAGIKFLMMSRHERGFYNWLSPDGSGVTAYSPGHYGDLFGILNGPYERVAPAVTKFLDKWTDYYPQHKIRPAVCILVSSDSSMPPDYGDLISTWNTKAGESGAPKLAYATSADFFRDAVNGAPEFPTITGERPNVWLYIHGPAHHWAISAKREAAVLLPAAELFATARALVEKDWASYPAEALNNGWKNAIYPDHGWGGHYGELTDKTFKEKLEFGRDTGRAERDKAVNALAGFVKADSVKGVPVVVFNALSWQRSDPVTCTIPAGTKPGKEFHVVGPDGRPVPSQTVLQKVSAAAPEIIFVAEDVPPMGYKTYYIIPEAKTGTLPETAVSPPETPFENSFYRIQLAPGGIRGILDKELGKEILRTDKFLGGELFTMQSVGNGAGEFTEVQKVTMEEFDHLARHAPAWRIVEAGPVRTVYELECAQDEGKFRHCSVVQRLTAYQNIKRLDVATEINGWDGSPYREFRLAFPVNTDAASIAYEVPMGVVEVGRSEIAGAAGERYKQPCKDVRPREIQNWICAGDESFGVTMSSSVAVADWVDPTDKPVSNPVLQPILLASRKSCHGLGNWYLQAGDHAYSFSIQSHKAGWQNGYRFGVQANNPLIAVVNPKRNPARALSESLSFCRTDQDNVIISAFKKADDDNTVALRCYDILGRDGKADIGFFAPIAAAERTNIIEEDGVAADHTENGVSIDVGHNAIETMRVTPKF